MHDFVKTTIGHDSDFEGNIWRDNKPLNADLLKAILQKCLLICNFSLCGLCLVCFCIELLIIYSHITAAFSLGHLFMVF